MNKAELRSQYKSGERKFREQDFSNLDLSYFQLAGADFSNSNFSRTNLRVAGLVGVNFSNCDLTFAELSSADLTDANLKGANLKGANLQGAHVNNIQYDAQTYFPMGFKPPYSEVLEVQAPEAPEGSAATVIRSEVVKVADPEVKDLEIEDSEIETENSRIPEVSDVSDISEVPTVLRSKQPEQTTNQATKPVLEQVGEPASPPTPTPSPDPPKPSDTPIASSLPKGSDPTANTVIRVTTTGSNINTEPTFGIEDTFIRPDPMPESLVPEAPPPEPKVEATPPVVPVAKVAPTPPRDAISDAKTVIPGGMLPESSSSESRSPTAVVSEDRSKLELPELHLAKLPLGQLAAIPWTTILSIVLLCGLAIYYSNAQQLKGLEIFWLISVFVICTIPSFASHHNRPSFSNLISAIGVPALGIINAFIHNGSLLKGWWVVFFLAAWLVVVSAQSKSQNHPNFSGHKKFVYLNNFLVSLGFILNTIVLKSYVPVYHDYLMQFQKNSKTIEFTINNMEKFFGDMEKIIGLIGHALGGIIFLLWSSFAFSYVASIYSLEYNKKWAAKVITVLGLGTLGIINFYLYPTNFVAGWWLVFVIGFILLIVNASIKIQQSK